MKEAYDHYVELTLGSDVPSEQALRVYDTNYGKLLPPDKDARILDIGIGVGGFLLFLRDRGYGNAQGIDISPSTIRSCMRKGLKCELVEDTATWLGSHGNEFDLIAMMDVIEHIPKVELIRLMSAVGMSLKPEGLLLVQTNNMEAEFAHVMRYGDITHQCGFCESSLRQVCLLAGFGKVDVAGLEPFYACRSWRYARQMPLKALQHAVFTPIRALYWAVVRVLRRLNCNCSPRILHPMFYAVVRK